MVGGKRGVGATKFNNDNLSQLQTSPSSSGFHHQWQVEMAMEEEVSQSLPLGTGQPEVKSGWSGGRVLRERESERVAADMPVNGALDPGFVEQLRPSCTTVGAQPDLEEPVAERVSDSGIKTLQLSPFPSWWSSRLLIAYRSKGLWGILAIWIWTCNIQIKSVY